MKRRYGSFWKTYKHDMIKAVIKTLTPRRAVLCRKYLPVYPLRHPIPKY